MHCCTIAVDLHVYPGAVDSFSCHVQQGKFLLFIDNKDSV